MGLVQSLTNPPSPDNTTDRPIKTLFTGKLIDAWKSLAHDRSQFFDFSSVELLRARSSVLRYVRLLTAEKSSWVRTLLFLGLFKATQKLDPAPLCAVRKRNDGAIVNALGLQSIVFICYELQ